MNLAIWDIESSSASTSWGSIIEIGGILVDKNFKAFGFGVFSICIILKVLTPLTSLDMCLNERSITIILSMILHSQIIVV